LPQAPLVIILLGQAMIQIVPITIL